MIRASSCFGSISMIDQNQFNTSDSHIIAIELAITPKSHIIFCMNDIGISIAENHSSQGGRTDL